MMRDAVLQDFSEIENLQISLTYDARLPKPDNISDAVAIDEQADVLSVWEACMRQADAVLLIAPETAGQLTQFTLIAEKLNKPVLGCHSSAVQIASDKYQTFLQLQRNGISTIPTYLFSDWPQNQLGPWIAKPIDGAGCGDTALFQDAQPLRDWMQSRKRTHIIQPLQTGIAASLSMLCRDGKAYLLTCNRQKITMESGVVQYHGSVVNELIQHQEAFDELAQKIAKTIPGLAGYVGVDVIVNDQNLYVVEINPRLTTSYVALHDACGVNPARMLLDLFYNPSFKLPAMMHHKIDISLDAAK